MSGGGKHEEHENHERWIIPYADMVTLLFAFFVVLYAGSLKDKAKLEQVSKSLQEAFLGQQGSMGKREIEVSFDESNSPPKSSPRFTVKRNVTNQEVIDELRKQLQVEGFDLVHNNEVQPIKVKIDSRGVIISVSAGYLFDKGSTEVRSELYPVIAIIADAIKNTNRLVYAEGHTDNLPTVGSDHYSNWEVSALRATSIVRLLVQEFGVEPNRLIPAGYAHYRPVASNESESGREQNRRVEIVMLNARSYQELFEEPSIPR